MFEQEAPKPPLIRRVALDENERISVLIRVDGEITLQPYSEQAGEIVLTASQALTLLNTLDRHQTLFLQLSMDKLSGTPPGEKGCIAMPGIMEFLTAEDKRQLSQLQGPVELRKYAYRLYTDAQHLLYYLTSSGEIDDEQIIAICMDEELGITLYELACVSGL